MFHAFVLVAVFHLDRSFFDRQKSWPSFRLPQDRIFLEAGALIAFNVTLKSHNLCLFFSVRIVSSRKLCNFECTLRVLSILSIKIRVAVVLFRFIHFHSLFVRSTFWACVCVHFSIRFVLCFFFLGQPFFIYISEKVSFGARCVIDLKLQKLQPYCTVLVNFSCVKSMCLRCCCYCRMQWTKLLYTSNT